LLNEADVAILCLPDSASRESVSLVTNPSTRIIDASTAFRTDPGWTYGLPEMQAGQREAVRAARRVSAPGCHATGFILALRPLITRGLVPPDCAVTSFSLTGYSGGGRKLIALFEGETGEFLPMAPYALGLQHKHLPEMQRYTGLRRAPFFQPVVGRFFRGMIVSVMLHARLLPGRPVLAEFHRMLGEAYAGEPGVCVMPLEFESALLDGMLSPTACNETNRVDLFVTGHDDQVEVLARLDNLGKGASGAVMQCFNLMIGADEFAGLDLGGNP
jgi:N-acetyl-gamma-glutamyl-phosphate reductase